MYTSLLVPIDLGHESSWRKALPLAVDLARTHGAELHVMVVV
ncbi:MAG: universal stress protein, partial [Gammaproteobacteria bacterium]|nr:universal stress protein [Gammaproteobacteria bacterium]NIT63454.1 universal stress protein [Gammaproteobacteria bacterium]NIV20386.1 universal stress protein [Gammaproteobacteria bacterium]NIY32034.1 universal stress protein [Gammaproteobacteria bacterium]